MTRRAENLLILFVMILIFCLAFGLRFWRIDSLVPVLNRDEAALAFTAYMLKEAGVDEWGRGWSLTQESFGDYKLVGYPTLLVGLFSAFPYQDWVVRLPSVMAGALLLLPAYFWTLWLTQSKRWSLLAAFLVAISPVFGHFSRFAYEANVALLLVTSSLLLLFKRFDHRKTQVAATLFGVGLYSLAITLYNTPFLYVPMLIPLYIFSKGFVFPKKWLLGSLLLCSVGITFFIAFQPLLSQKSGISIFTDDNLLINVYPQYVESLSSALKPVFDSRYVFFLSLFVNRFFSSFSPYFLVQNGGQHPWHSLTGYAHLTWSVYILSIAWIITYVSSAVFKLCQHKRNILHNFFDGKLFSAKLVLILLLLMSLIPASVTVDAPHATRSMFFFFGLTLAAVLMLQILFEWIRARNLRLSLMILTVLLVVMSIEHANYWVHYFTQYSSQQKSLYYPGFDEIIEQVNQSYPNQPVAIVDPTHGFQYISLAWYTLPEPSYYLQSQVRQLPDGIGFRYGERVGKFHFIAKADDRNQSEKIIVRWNHDLQQWSIETF